MSQGFMRVGCRSLKWVARGLKGCCKPLDGSGFLIGVSEIRGTLFWGPQKIRILLFRIPY